MMFPWLQGSEVVGARGRSMRRARRGVRRDLAFEHASETFLADDATAFGDNLAAGDRHYRPAGHGEILPRRVIGAVMQDVLANGLDPHRVPQGDVGVEADADRA